jgi:integrase
MMLILIVNKAMVDSENSYKIGTTKTASSNRKIAIGDTLIKILKSHKKFQKEMKLKYGKYYNDKNNALPNLICTKEDGSQLTYRNLGRITESAKNKLNLYFTFHMLRHTHATMMIQSGVNIKDVLYRLGHSKVSTTLDVYSHVTDESKNLAVEIFESAIK